MDIKKRNRILALVIGLFAMGIYLSAIYHVVTTSASHERDR